ncbi:unnamed protein product [Staurois parvus]|uniref:Uncharacterized protein n=1 Tax=Staurois parvus TaxID=386267 RepID=A0ABN9BIK5_9NEOB|nr:unnamed protein product [Staurois parvus]
MAGPSEKRGRGRPLGSTKKVTVLSKINSLLKRPQDVPVKRARGRPRLMRIEAVDIPKAKVSDCPRNRIAEHLEDSRKASIRAKRKDGLLRLHNSAAKNAGPHPLLKREKAVNIPNASVRVQGPTHNTNIIKYIDEQGRSLTKNILVDKKLQASLKALVGTKRRRGRPRKDSASNVLAGRLTTMKRKPAGVASVTVVVEKRGRGRPRKVQPEKGIRDQVSLFSHDLWNGSLQYGQYQEMDQFQSPSGFFNSYRPRNPAEMSAGFADTEHLQLNQQGRSPSLDVHGCWVNGELRTRKKTCVGTEAIGSDGHGRCKMQIMQWTTTLCRSG